MIDAAEHATRGRAIHTVPGYLNLRDKVDRERKRMT